MKGFLLTLTGLLVSASAFASNVQVQLKPASPLVVDGDTYDNGNLVKGRWFQVTFEVTNTSNEPVTLLALSLEAGNGTSIAHKDFVMDQRELLPGATRTYGPFYMGGLDKAPKSYVYDVTAHLMGWTGTADSPNDRVDETLTFQTK